MLHHRVDLQRQQDALAQRVLVEQRRDIDVLRVDELLDEPHQLEQQVLAPPLEAAGHLVERLLRCAEDQALKAELVR